MQIVPGATSKHFIHYIKPTLQENECDVGCDVTYRRKCFEIRFQYWHCVKRYHKYYKLMQKFSCNANHYFCLDTYQAVKCKLYFTSLTI